MMRAWRNTLFHLKDRPKAYLSKVAVGRDEETAVRIAAATRHRDLRRIGEPKACSEGESSGPNLAPACRCSLTPWNSASCEA
jgi:hypothetical protein